MAYVDGPPPPNSPALEHVGKGLGLGFEDASNENWTRSKEAGLLDASIMEKKDRQALLEKISRLEGEVSLRLYSVRIRKGVDSSL